MFLRLLIKFPIQMIFQRASLWQGRRFWPVSVFWSKISQKKLDKNGTASYIYLS